ncbi:MAG: alpha-amylase family glycosyl hydrolase [Fervidobacterium sp.]
MFGSKKLRRKNKTSFLIFTAFLFIYLLFSCTNAITSGKISVKVSISIPSTNEYTEYTYKSGKTVPLVDYASLLKKVELEVLDSEQKSVVRQETTQVSNPRFEISLNSTGTYKFIIRGYNESSVVILQGDAQKQIVAGVNNVSVTTDFVSGTLEVKWNFSDNIWNYYNISNSTVKFYRPTTDQEFVETINFDSQMVTMQKTLYPAIWKVEFSADFSEKQQGTMNPANEHVTVSRYVQINPTENTRIVFNVSYDSKIIVDVAVEGVSFPYVEPVQNLSGTYNTDLNELTLSWNHSNTQATYYVFKRLKGENFYQLVGQTTSKVYQIENLTGDEYWKIEAFGVNAVVEGKESGIIEISKDRIQLTSLNIPLTSSTMYTLFVRSFYDSNGDGIGDFKGVEQKVSYLKDLGIDTVWFLPFTKAKSYHGYDVEDFYDTEPDYGTLSDLDSMIKQLNQNGIKIVMDLVVNHTSDTHPWFLDAIENTTSSLYWNYYIMSLEQPQNTNHWHWKINQKGQKVWYFGLFDSSMPDLNYENPQVLNEVKKIIDFWITMGVDGFRLDAAKHYFGWDWNDGIDQSADVAKQIEEYIRNKLGDGAIVVSEVYDGSTTTLSKFAPMPVFNFTFMYNITSNFEGIDNLLSNSIGWVNSIASQYQLTTYHFPFIDSHDLNRFISVLIDDKYHGDATSGTKQYLLTNALLLSLNGMPTIYYGNEIGLRGWKWSTDPWDMPVREPMQWYASQQGVGQPTWTKSIYQEKNITFGNANVDGAMYDDPFDGVSVEEQQNGYAILNFFEQFIYLRKTYPALAFGNLSVERDWKNLYVIKRSYGTQHVLVLINLDPTYSNTYEVPATYRWVWYAFFNGNLFEFGPKSEEPLSQNTNWTINPRQIYVFVNNQ